MARFVFKIIPNLARMSYLDSLTGHTKESGHLDLISPPNHHTNPDVCREDVISDHILTGRIKIMPSNIKYRKRSTTITMPIKRSRMIGLACAKLGLKSHEQFIQSCITAGLIELARRDETFAMMIVREAGIDWETLTRLSDNECVAELLDIKVAS